MENRQFSLRAVFGWVTGIAVVLGLYFGTIRWFNSGLRKNDRAAFTDYIVNGTLEDPEKLRGRGFFSDDELDALIAERNKRAAVRSQLGESP